jgi:hypothetical protein
MVKLWLDVPPEAEAVSIASTTPTPPGFVSVGECLPQGLDRRLGYFGQARFVFFYYEARGSEVVWNDGLSYGFSCGGWIPFTQELAPLARQYNMELGSDHNPAADALVLDLKLKRAYFAPRSLAKQLVLNQHELPIR